MACCKAKIGLTCYVPTLLCQQLFGPSSEQVGKFLWFLHGTSHGHLMASTSLSEPFESKLHKSNLRA